MYRYNIKCCNDNLLYQDITITTLLNNDWAFVYGHYYVYGIKGEVL